MKCFCRYLISFVFYIMPMQCMLPLRFGWCLFQVFRDIVYQSWLTFWICTSVIEKCIYQYSSESWTEGHPATWLDKRNLKTSEIKAFQVHIAKWLSPLRFFYVFKNKYSGCNLVEFFIAFKCTGKHLGGEDFQASIPTLK